MRGWAWLIISNDLLAINQGLLLYIHVFADNYFTEDIIEIQVGTNK